MEPLLAVGPIQKRTELQAHASTFHMAAHLVKPYLQRLKPWMVLLLLLVLVGVAYPYELFVSNVQRDAINELQAKKSSKFFEKVTILSICLAGNLVVSTFTDYVTLTVALMCRRGMTRSFLRYYLRKSSSFYHGTQLVENPDQRICSDIETFVHSPIELLLKLVQKLVVAIGFLGLLWERSHELLYACIASVLVSIVIASVVGGPLKRLQFNVSRREGDLRFRLARLREHVETVALSGGGPYEERSSSRRLDRLVRIQHLHILASCALESVRNVLENIGLVLPLLLMGPRFMAGEVEWGDVHQAQTAFTKIHEALGEVMHSLLTFQDVRAALIRLYTLKQACDAGGERAPQLVDEAPSRPDHDGATPMCLLHVKGLHLHAPCDFAAAPLLISNLSLQLMPGQRLLVIGPSGAGKTALLRAIAGLWHAAGSVAVNAESLYVPQRPYLIGSSLVEDLTYPLPVADWSADAALSAIARVGLGHLREHLPPQAELGGCDEAAAEEAQTRKLGPTLTRTEQQQLAIARLLLHVQRASGSDERQIRAHATPPNRAVQQISSTRRIVFLDEPTAAMDAATEKCVYDAVNAVVDTYVSIGAPSSSRLLAYHTHVLRLDGVGGRWTLVSSAEFAAAAAQGNG